MTEPSTEKTVDEHFLLLEFNPRRKMRSAPAARVQIDPSGQWLWMDERDLRANIRDFGSHPELQKALDAYKGKQAEISNAS